MNEYDYSVSDKVFLTGCEKNKEEYLFVQAKLMEKQLRLDLGFSIGVRRLSGRKATHTRTPLTIVLEYIQDIVINVRVRRITGAETKISCFQWSTFAEILWYMKDLDEPIYYRFGGKHQLEMKIVNLRTKLDLSQSLSCLVPLFEYILPRYISLQHRFYGYSESDSDFDSDSGSEL